MHLIIFCSLKAMWNASSVYLHHLCLIFLAGTDTSFRIPSLMRSQGDTSFTTPRRGLCQTRRSAWCIHPSRRRPSPHGTKGFPLIGGGTFFFYVGGSQGFGVRTRRCIRPMDIPALPRSRRLLGTVDEPNLGQKPKL